MNNEYEQKQDDISINKPGDADPKDDLGLSENPDQNVDMDGDCILPPHAESARMNTGAPCDDGILKK